MADIVARLRLDNKDYDDKLAKAKNSAKKFSQEGGASISDLAGKFTAMAGAVAGCKAVMDTFNAVMNSSQTYADTYANAIATVKGVVDNVVYSVANADFSSFERGLRSVAEASWAASAALDQLWNTKQSASYFTNKNRAQLAELLNVVKDESKTAEQRKQAQAMIDAVIKDQQEVVAVTRQDVDKAIYAMINDAAGGRLTEGQVNKALIEETLRIDVSVDRDKLKKEIEDGYAEYRKLSEEIYEKNSKWETKTDRMGRIVSQSKVVSEEGKAALAALDAQYADIIVKHSTLEVMSDEELAALIEQLNYAEQQTKVMEKMVAQRVAISNQLAKQLPMEQQITSEYQKRDVKMAGIPTGATSPGELTSTITADIPMVIPQEAIDSVENYNNALKVLEETEVSASDGLGAIGNMMGAIGGQMGEGAGAWMSYAGSIISAVGSALPSLEALAAAQAAAAATKTALSPWTVIASVAAVGSIVAAMANLPKFAQGGIVPGTSYTGDNVLIRANSGERVLTRSERAQYERGMGFGGTVKFKIEGGDLVGVLNNNQKIASRSYGS